MDEIVLGFDGHPNSATLVRLSAMARREQQLLGVVDNGVPESSYTLSHVARSRRRPGRRSRTIQLLPIFNRPAATFGRDTYVLTNPADNEATLVGVDLNIQSHTDRLFYLFGATASRSEGLAGNRGFLATENDEGVLGDVFIDPNSRTFAQGRMFTERGLHDQDRGQPITSTTTSASGSRHDTRTASTSRVSFIAPDLTQGAGSSSARFATARRGSRTR